MLSRPLSTTLKYISRFGESEQEVYRLLLKWNTVLTIPVTGLNEAIAYDPEQWERFY